MPRPVRVLAIGSVYPPHHLGGYEIIWRGVMRHLREQGHLARTLVTGYRREDAAVDDEADRDVHRELQWYWQDHQWRSLGLRERLELERHNAAVFDRHLHDFQPDVITWWPVGGLSLGLIERARRAGVPALLFVLDPWSSYGRERDLWLHMWARLGPAARLADRMTGLPTRVDWSAAGRWVFCSRTMRENTRAAGIEVADSIILTPGVERSYGLLAHEPAPAAWRGRLVYVGRVVEQKGVDTAIRSLESLPEAQLRIVGEGDEAYRGQLEALAAALGVAERVRFDGHRAQSELPGIYREADAVVFPVVWPEPWGLVPLEAMALGRPVIATGKGGSGEYLVDGRNALLFTAGDAEALAAAVRTLAQHDSLRERLIRGGYETVAAHGEEAFNQRALEEILAAAKVPPEPR
jgi:glycogen synthase